MQNVAVKAAVTPLLIGGASLAGRKWGHHIGGWLVALPLTSGPIAFFLATDHGTDFAGRAAVGMLAGTISQVAFALAYRRFASEGWVVALGSGSLAFAAATVLLSAAHWSVVPTFALVSVAIGLGFIVIKRSRESVDDGTPSVATPRWDISFRMVVATGVVIFITALAPVIGPHLAGLLSPFPVFGAVVAIFTHHSHGPAAASAALDGLVMGLAAPAVFFLALGLSLPTLASVFHAGSATRGWLRRKVLDSLTGRHFRGEA